nr:hypothetical protein [Tanacetum cinerariifolium]
ALSRLEDKVRAGGDEDRITELIDRARAVATAAET